MLRSIVSMLIVGLSLACVIAGLSSSAMAATHDGNWTVLVITEKGTCDRAYRYDVAVANGKVSYQGDSAVNLTGTVAKNGAVMVHIKFAGQGADGQGRLSGRAGAGRWRGSGSSGDCSGRWEAERR